MNNNNEQRSAGTPKAERAAVQPVGIVTTWNKGGSGEHNAIEPYDKYQRDERGYSLAAALPEGTLIYTSTPVVAASQPTPSKEGEQSNEWKVGSLLTMSDCDYPGMGGMFAQVWQGDSLIARVYGDNADEVRSRAASVAATIRSTPSDSASVDTAELNKLAAVFIACVQREQVSAGKVAWQQIIAHIESLVTAAAAGERKDAERYRWLRNPTEPVGTVLDKKIDGDYWEYRAGEELDAAIDSAMAAHSPATSSKEGASDV